MIEFTQYLRPDGRREQIHIERSPEIEEKAKAIVAHGWAFEAEVLMTGTVSLTVCGEQDGEMQDLFFQLCHNGPGVGEAVDNLVNAAYQCIPETKET